MSLGGQETQPSTALRLRGDHPEHPRPGDLAKLDRRQRVGRLAVALGDGNHRAQLVADPHLRDALLEGPGMLAARLEILEAGLEGLVQMPHRAIPPAARRIRPSLPSARDWIDRVATSLLPTIRATVRCSRP